MNKEDHVRYDQSYQTPPESGSQGHNHNAGGEEYSDSSDEEFVKDTTTARDKKMKKVDVMNPFSTFEKQTSNRKKHFVPSPFIKEKWLVMRGMNNESGKYISEDDSKPDMWKNVAKSDKLIRKYSGEVFADTKLDDGLHSIVDKKETHEEKDLVKSQRIYGSIGHLSLKAMEGYAGIYEKIQVFGNKMLGYPQKVNPAWQGEEDKTNSRYIWSEQQIQAYNEMQSILTEFQVDVSEPLSNIARVSASAFTNIVDKRREKILSRIRKNNSNAATAINRIPPSAYSLFGGDHSQLEKVVKLTRDLTTTSSGKSGGHGNHFSQFKGSGGGRGGIKSNGKERDGADRGKADLKAGAGRGLGKFRGGNAHRGRKN